MLAAAPVDEQSKPEGGSGWTFGRVVGLLVGLLGMAGFGVCSLCGIVVSLDGKYFDGFLLMLIILGLGLCALCCWLVVTMFRRAREERERNNP
jgi:hypothetical protein